MPVSGSALEEVKRSWGRAQAALLTKNVGLAELDAMLFDDFGALIGAMVEPSDGETDGVSETQAEDADRAAMEAIKAARERNSGKV